MPMPERHTLLGGTGVWVYGETQLYLISGMFDGQLTRPSAGLNRSAGPRLRRDRNCNLVRLRYIIPGVRGNVS